MVCMCVCVSFSTFDFDANLVQLLYSSLNLNRRLRRGEEAQQHVQSFFSLQLISGDGDPYRQKGHKRVVKRKRECVSSSHSMRCDAIKETIYFPRCQQQ